MGYKKGLLVLLAFLLLTACEKKDKMAELKQKMAETKSKIVARQAALPQLEKVKSTNYQSEHLISPFILKRLANNNANGDAAAPLRQFPLTELKYLGIISHPTAVWAVIGTPDQRVYRVTVGDKIGSEGGQIQTIANSKITVAIPMSSEGKGIVIRELMLSNAAPLRH